MTYHSWHPQFFIVQLLFFHGFHHVKPPFLLANIVTGGKPSHTVPPLLARDRRRRGWCYRSRPAKPGESITFRKMGHLRNLADFQQKQDRQKSRETEQKRKNKVGEKSREAEHQGSREAEKQSGAKKQESKSESKTNFQNGSEKRLQRNSPSLPFFLPSGNLT